MMQHIKPKNNILITSTLVDNFEITNYKINSYTINYYHWFSNLKDSLFYRVLCTKSQNN